MVLESFVSRRDIRWEKREDSNWHLRSVTIVKGAPQWEFHPDRKALATDSAENVFE